MGTKIAHKDRLETEYIVLFDSRDSKRASDTSWDFQVRFHDLEMGVLKNVSSVEVIGLAFPRVKQEDYVFLSIPELSSTFLTTDPHNPHPTFMFYYDSYNVPACEKKAMKGGDFYKKVLTFQPFVTQLSQLTFVFTKYGGDITLEDLDLDDPGETPHVSIILKITTTDPFSN